MKLEYLQVAKRPDLAATLGFTNGAGKVDRGVMQ
jgi:hypothetical protein